MVREIIVIKKPRDEPIIDKPINFPALQNLHLDLMENKRKLKKNLPLIQVVKKKPIPINVIESSEPKPETKPSPVEKENKDDDGGNENVSEPVDEEDADMLSELREENEGSKTPELIELESEGTKPSKVADSPTPPEEPPQEEEEDDDPYSGLSPEERESKEKEEYIWRFNILRRQHKNKDIPHFNEHDDLTLMKTAYERKIREIHLESSVDTYRTYLIGGFMVIEFVSNNWMGVDLTGFTSQQMLLMDKYDRLLIELGERSYNRWGMNLPVELRLIGFILIQAGLFYLGKIISTKAGGSVAELFRGITGQTKAPTENKVRTEEVDVPPRKKMKGPSIKVEDIKKMTDDGSEE